MDERMSEELLALRQLELRAMAQEMALIAKRLGASDNPAASAQIEQLEGELQRTRAHHAAVWRHIATEDRRRAHAYQSLMLAGAGVGLGLIGFAFAISRSRQ